ncbi:MAG: SDR family oxidoreductase [Bacteroidia bacterium]|nr:SDR family oxidoreductase [Bacteroidia bacterium]
MFAKELFNNQVALVTGGRSGIGYATAKMILQHGGKVMIASRKAGLLEKAAKELAKLGEVGHHPCDIRQTEQIKELAKAIEERFGKLDILINNAGGQFPSLARTLNDKGWNAVINNNLNGTFYMTREMANHFFIPQKHGVVVNVIVNLLRGFPGMVHTGAARAGIENMTKTLAVEWSEYNIRLNCLAPGIIESSGLELYPPPVQQMFAEAKKGIPMQRFGKVDEVATSICYLASPLSSYVNGISLYVDGAQHLNYNVKGLSDTLNSFLS